MSLIEGRVVDARGRPVAQAVIHIVSSPRPLPDIAQVSDERGRFTLALGPGSYVLGARSDAIGSGRVAVEVPGEAGPAIALVIPLTAPAD